MNYIAQQGGQGDPLSDNTQIESVFYKIAGGFTSTGGLGLAITDSQISSGKVFATTGMAKLIKFAAGPGAAAINVVVSAMVLARVEKMQPHDLAKFVTNLAIVGVGFVPGVGPVLSFGLSLADSAGALDDFYNFFDNPNEGATRHPNWDSGQMLPIDKR